MQDPRPAPGAGRIGELVLVAVVAAIGQQEAWAPLGTLSFREGPAPVLAAGYAITAGVLLLRRRFPVLVVATVAITLATLDLAYGSADGLAPLVPVLIAFEAAGRHCDDRRFWLAALITAAGTAVHEWRDPRFELTGPTLMFWAVIAASGVLGRLLRRRAEESRQRAAAAAAEERLRLTQELHDLVGHGLTLLVLQLVAAQEALPPGSAPLADRLDQLEATARSTLAEMRRLISVSDAGAPLSPQPGLGDLEELVAGVRRSGIAVELDAAPGLDAPPGVGLTVYRIVQEALTNVARHGGGRGTTRVVLDARDGDLAVDVLDEGTAAGPAAGVSRGRGLDGMRRRARLYGGTVQAGPRPEGGFAVRARIPLTGEHR